VEEELRVDWRRGETKHEVTKITKDQEEAIQSLRTAPRRMECDL